MTKFKLVPIEPTREMERAAESYWNERRFKGLSDDPRTWAGVYQSMLDAAKQQPAPDVEILVGALESIAEYWNQDSNEDAMRDACEYAKTAAQAALAAYHKQDGDLCTTKD